MRLIDADELMEHVWRDKLDSRELIAKMINYAPTIKDIPTKIPINIFEQLISKRTSEMTSEPDAVSFKVDGDVVVKYEYIFGPKDGATKYKAKAVMTKEIFQECYEKWIKPQIRIVCDCCPQEVNNDKNRN